MFYVRVDKMEYIKNIHTFNDKKYGVVPIWFERPNPIKIRKDVIDIIREIASKYNQVHYYWFEGKNGGKVCTVCYIYFLNRDVKAAAEELYSALDPLKSGYIDDDAYINNDQPSQDRI